MADKTKSTFDAGAQVANPHQIADLAGNGSAYADVAALYLWNATSGAWSKEPAPTDITVLPSAGRTTTQTQADQINLGHRGIMVVLDMTVVGTGSVTLTIQGKDVASGKYYTLLAGAAVITNSTNVYTVFPSAPATANVSANAELPGTWRILVTANNANAATYSVGASLML